MARIYGDLRFPDGKIKIFVYCNTNDVVFGKYFNYMVDCVALEGLVGDIFSCYDLLDKECNHEPQRVEFYLPEKSISWVGSACKCCNTILSGLDPACNTPIYENHSDGGSFYSREFHFDCGDEGPPINIKSRED